VVAKSFERIHRSNLIGMGVLPLQFKAGDSWESLGLKGDEVVDVELADEIKPLSDATLVITGPTARAQVPVTLRIDTPIEVDYYKHGGILPFVLRQLLRAPCASSSTRSARTAPRCGRPANRCWTASAWCGCRWPSSTRRPGRRAR
jgi:hypothetical protein